MTDLANLRTIKTFMFIENLLGIHRNYKLKDEKKRKLVLFHVIIQLCFCVVFAVNDFYVLHEYFHNNLSGLCIATTMFLQFTCYAILCIIHGISQSQSFKELFNILEKMHKNFKDDVSYTKSLKMIFTCVLAVVYFVAVTGVILYERIHFPLFDYLLYFDILQYLHKVIIDYRYLVEYLVYSLYLKIICEIFKRFNGLLDEAYKRLDMRIDGDITDEIDLKMIEDWAGMYMDLVQSGKSFRKCFGLQIIFAIVVFTLNYILLSHRFWIVLLEDFYEKKRDVTAIMNMSFEMIYHTTVVVIAALTAQRVQNEAWHLRRTLARLYNVLTGYPNRAELRKMRNFIRMVEKNPVEINYMPEFVMGLAVLPMSFSIGVPHVIVLLQLDKII